MFFHDVSFNVLVGTFSPIVAENADICCPMAGHFVAEPTVSVRKEELVAFLTESNGADVRLEVM